MGRSATVEYAMGREANKPLKKTNTVAVATAERDEPARSLVESLDSSKDKSVRAAWDAEISRRIDEIDSGKVKPVPIKHARRRLALAR
jgi:putative addiction module component (TIGR02574 family)